MHSFTISRSSRAGCGWRIIATCPLTRIAVMDQSMESIRQVQLVSEFPTSQQAYIGNMSRFLWKGPRQRNKFDFFTNMDICSIWLLKMTLSKFYCQNWPGGKWRKWHVSLPANSDGGKYFPPPELAESLLHWHVAKSQPQPAQRQATSRQLGWRKVTFRQLSWREDTCRFLHFPPGQFCQ
jgi:hypothetical protein